MDQLFFMTNLFMKFQNCNLIFVTDANTHGRMIGQSKSNMPLQLFQSWGHKNREVRTLFHGLSDNPSCICNDRLPYFLFSLF